MSLIPMLNRISDTAKGKAGHASRLSTIPAAGLGRQRPLTKDALHGCRVNGWTKRPGHGAVPTGNADAVSDTPYPEVVEGAGAALAVPAAHPAPAAWLFRSQREPAAVA